MAPVVLHMDVHCYGCGKKIRKALQKIPGVEGVSSSFETNTVVVTGTANAEELRARLEIKMRKSVTILSNGVAEPPARSRRARSPSPPTPAPPTSPPRSSRPPTSPPGYSRLPTSPPRYRPPTSPPNYAPPTFAPPPPPRPNYLYDYPYGQTGSLALFSDENPDACSIQ